MASRLTALIAKLPAQAGRNAADPLAGTARPTGSFSQQLRAAGLTWRLVAWLGAHAADTALVLASWVCMGSGALNGRLDPSLVAVWALCLGSAMPIRVGARWLEGVLAIGIGGLLKERLLAGAMVIDPEIVRRRGVGEHLGDVIELDEIERVAAGGGLDVVVATCHLCAAPFLFWWGAATRLEMGVLAGWAGMAAMFVAIHVRDRSRWTRQRLDLTQRTVEQMIGHRTRAVQQQPAAWHRDEDQELGQYAAASASLDQSTSWMEAALPRGYVLVALAVLAGSFVTGGATPAQQAVTLGAILFTGGAFQRMAFWAPRAVAAWIAWRTTKPMYDAASEAPHESDVVHATAGIERVLHAQDLSFTHRGRITPAVHACSLTIERGDAVLLEGESGSGKSTLASLLANVRRPSSGIVLASGLDAQTLGASGWRRRVAAAPQDHENHIMSASLAYNLLLGRPFPHSAQDLADALAVCHELGLGPLVERMPAGLDQMVGDTGWQLSHGERSRVFLGRALLQGADLVVVDESLSALDPDTQRQCLESVMRRAPALLMVAHP